jgi:hypothetical protein
VRAVDSLDATERTAMRRALHQVLSTLATSGAHRRSVFARTARTSAERCAATCRARAPRPLNACSSVFRFSQRT